MVCVLYPKANVQTGIAVQKRAIIGKS